MSLLVGSLIAAGIGAVGVLAYELIALRPGAPWPTISAIVQAWESSKPGAKFVAFGVALILIDGIITLLLHFASVL